MNLGGRGAAVKGLLRSQPPTAVDNLLKLRAAVWRPVWTGCGAQSARRARTAERGGA